MTHVEALNLERLPEHVVVLGGGYVGLEFAQALRRFGSQVTIIQRGPRLLEREDPDVSEALQDLMIDEGIAVFVQTDVLHVTGRSGASVTLQVRGRTAKQTLVASDILVAAGRTPNTDRLDAAKAGVELDSRGYIQVNDRLQTSALTCWATGECAGSPSSPMSAKTIVAWCWTACREVIVPRAAGSFRTACSPIRSLPTSA